MRAVSEAKCFLCPPDGLSGRDQPVELLNPARVNHMPGSGKSARPALLRTRRHGRGVWVSAVLGGSGEKGVGSQAHGSWLLFPGVKIGHWFWKRSGLRLILPK